MGIGGETNCRKSCSGEETRITHVFGEAQRALEERAREQSRSEGKGCQESAARAESAIQLYRSGVPHSERGGWIRAGLQHAGDRRPNPVFQLIVGQQVTQAANDKQQAGAVAGKGSKNESGQKPEKEVVADNGYCSDENLKYLNKRKIERIRSDGKAEAQRTARTLQTRAVTEGGASRVERMERKLATQVGAAVYATQRKLHR